ncbi:unnamed protein product, partial [Ceratitis capitata]
AALKRSYVVVDCCSSSACRSAATAAAECLKMRRHKFAFATKKKEIKNTTNYKATCGKKVIAQQQLGVQQWLWQAKY